MEATGVPTYYKVRVDSEGFVEDIKMCSHNGEPMGFAAYNQNRVMLYRVATMDRRTASVEAQRFARQVIDAGVWGDEGKTKALEA